MYRRLQLCNLAIVQIQALVWPVYYGDHDKIAVLIRCFLPGAGT